ncbi:hypothetical protein ACHMW6_26030 [Pseudoduganella sp. UC29_106]|uniref:hypothetical protein n=1 Tax=Pseudoduganella sp. UC29_106 TaxID=3374553 RepID=UPI003756302A
MRWVAALGADYGMIAVRADSPYRTLGELVAALKRDPSKVLIGVSGTIGSQDWLKVALLVRQAGIDPKVLRFVALEGGGEAFTALQANCARGLRRRLRSAPDGAGRQCAACWRCCPNSVCRACWRMFRLRASRATTWSGPSSRGVWMGPQVEDADYAQWVKRSNA